MEPMAYPAEIEPLLAKLYERIDLVPEEVSQLLHGHGVSSVNNWIDYASDETWLREKIPLETAVMLNAALRYLIKQLSLNPNDEISGLLEHLLQLPEKSPSSWESFVYEYTADIRIADDDDDNEEEEGEEKIDNKLSLPRKLKVPAHRATTSFKRKVVCESDFDQQSIERLENSLKSDTWDFNHVSRTVKFVFRKKPIVNIPFAVMARLYPFQITGVERMLENFARKRKGIMCGDAPGMGKTLQSLVVIMALMADKHIARALCIVPPGPMLKSWQKETRLLVKLWPSLKGELQLVEYSSSESPKDRIKRLRETRREAKSIITFTSNAIVAAIPSDAKKSKYGTRPNPLVPTGPDKTFRWDVVVLDEAHNRAKNQHTGLSDALRSPNLMRGAFRLFLTATPMQNHLGELCTLLDTMLDLKKSDGNESYLTWYDNNKQSYKAGQQKSSSKAQQHKKDQIIADFQSKAHPFFFQRSKEDHLRDEIPAVARYDIWVPPSKTQREEASKFMRTSDIAVNARESNFKALPAIAQLRQICLHPFFTSSSEDEDDDGDWRSRLNDYLDMTSVDRLRGDSPKLALCADMVKFLTENGHKILVFSEFKRPFYILEKILQSMGIGVYRMHGDEPQSHRSHHIESFNSTKALHKVMLLTTGASGLGLTLTGADRMILLSPHWNPSKEEQAEGRMHRIGQKKKCVAYRIFNVGTIEQSIQGYQHQKEANSLEALTDTKGHLVRLYDDRELRAMLFREYKSDEATNMIAKLPAASEAQKQGNELAFVVKHKLVKGVTKHKALYPKFKNRFLISSTAIKLKTTTDKRTVSDDEVAPGQGSPKRARLDDASLSSSEDELSTPSDSAAAESSEDP